MTNLFSAIQNVHAQVPGWTSWYKAQTLAATVLSMRPSVIVEIGVWGGKSLIPMAMAQNAVVPSGVTYAIDAWKAEASVEGQLNPADVEWWGEQGKHDWAFEQFNKFRSLTQLEHVIEVIRMTSDEAPIPPEIGLLSVDGNHGEQSIRDVKKFAPAVEIGGVVFMDDIQWTGGAVIEAAKLLTEMGFQELYIVNDPETKNQWGAFLRIK